MSKKRVAVIGAGPAGLTAAYELLEKSKEYEVIVLEESDVFGGISKTVNYKGNRMDMGGHRFFSKVPEVNVWWNKMLPMQGAPGKDEILLQKEFTGEASETDPEKMDEVFLQRTRVSRIFFDDKFYDYPIRLNSNTLKNMGFKKTMEVGFSYLGACIHKRPETNLENFYINRFGKKLYSMFFEYYTENLWGRHPKEIDASWGSQRVKGLSIRAVLGDIIGKKFKKKNRKVETSLIESFMYPKFGPGQLWEVTAEKISEMGGRIYRNAKVIGLQKEDEKISHLLIQQDGKEETMDVDIVISSMPLKELVQGMNDVPVQINSIAAGLPYRDYITLGVLVPRLKLKNKTTQKTVGNIIPDCWVYVQDRRVKMGRFQVYNNWSPYMVNDFENTVWIGLEYFVTEGDELWEMSEAEFASFCTEEMLKIGLIEQASDVLDTHREKIKKAYPAYFDTYSEIDKLVAYLSEIENLYCVGRNGQHRYNNMDHSMVTAFETVNHILHGGQDKRRIWDVNTEKDYHEVKE